MWRDIFIANREALAAAMKLFGDTFADFQRAIDTGDMDALEKLFDRGRRMREKMK